MELTILLILNYYLSYCFIYHNNVAWLGLSPSPSKFVNWTNLALETLGCTDNATRVTVRFLWLLAGFVET